MLQLRSSEHILPKAKDIKGDDACGFTILDDAVLVAVLCDGVGSARKGGAAARQTVQYILKQFKARPTGWSVEHSITVFTQHINRMLFKESMTQYEQIELLTTLCIAVIEGETLYTMSLGDSRIYLQERGGKFLQLTEDQTMDDEHMSHVLTQACGLNEHVEPIVNARSIKVGETLMLCSDGVYGLADDETLAEQIGKGLSARLIINNAAKDHKDDERDDMSLQIFHIDSLDELYTIKNEPLPIPEVLKAGDDFDGYLLKTPLMTHKRIWKAEKDGLFYVIKFPMSHDDEQALEEFVHEAWYAKQITHKAFGDAWVPEDRTARYYVMELIEGKDLKEYLQDKHLSVDSAIALAKFLHRAEAHLLHLGLVHGDIKPENIIVSRDKDSAGTSFKMVDFGSMVRLFAENSRAGTPTFLAPERFTGAAINESTELFAIGVTLYWALTKKYPYGDIEPFQTPTFKQAKPPSRYNKNIPQWLDSIIMRTIAIDPDERYSHYSEFFYELKAPDKVKPYFAKDAPLIEREPLLFYKFGFFIMLFLELLTIIFLSE